MKNGLLKRTILMVLGVAMIGISVALEQFAGLGTDPFTCMNMGIGVNVLKIGYGNFQVLLNIVLLIPMLICMRKAIGIGTITNMVGVGYIAELVRYLLHQVGVNEAMIQGQWWLRIVILFVALVVLTFGVGLYMECNLGVAPYDALGDEVEQWTKGHIPFRFARMGLDVICVGVGFLCGSVIGICTLVVALGTGPIVSFFRSIVKKHILKENVDA